MSVAARPNNARARAAAAWSATVGAQQVTMPGAEGAKAACEGVGILKVARSLGIGTGTVQRISGERATSLRGA